MFGSGVIELVIGLSLVYLLFSLVCSGVNELAEHALRRRAVYLEIGLRQLLGPAMGELMKHPLIEGLKPPLGRSDRPRGGPTRAKTIRTTLSRAGKMATRRLGLGNRLDILKQRKSKPSYIPATTFSAALLSLVGGEDVAGQVGVEAPTVLDSVKRAIERLADNDHLKRVLQALLVDANNDLSTFKRNIEDWFDGAMDRVSGWYKRRTRGWLLLWALIIVGAFNADTILFAKTLWNSNTIRSSIVAEAQAAAGGTSDPAVTPCPSPSPGQNPFQCVADRIEEIKALQLPFGWSTEAGDRKALSGTGQWILRIAGLLITAGALTLGAPFWFDLLNRFVNFRASGAPPRRPT
jgi:hypothetical protein